MGFLGCVFNDGGARGKGRSQDQIHRRSNRCLIQINMGSSQALLGGMGNNKAVAHLHFSAEGNKAFDMQVNGPRAQIAAARHCNLSISKPSQQSTNKIIRSPELAR